IAHAGPDKETSLHGGHLPRNSGFVRRTLTWLLVLLFAVQLGSACVYAYSTTDDGMNCCATNCPPHSSSQPLASCCHVSASSDKAVSQARPAANAELARVTLDSVALRVAAA